MLETQDTITFNDKGICSTCQSIEVKNTKIDWAGKRKEFEKIAAEYKGQGVYDCIVPFSGGKDSTFTALALVRDFGLKPLIVGFDHGFYRPVVLRNQERTVKKLGTDYLKFRTDWQTVKKLMRISLERKGSLMWHAECGIFSYPMRVAIEKKVPLVIWGEPSSEYVSYYSHEDEEQVDEKRFNRMVNMGINAEDMIGFLDGSVTERDLLPYTYPSAADLRALKVRSICLGSYIPWDPIKQSERCRDELGWQGDHVEGIPFDRYWYEKIEDAFQGIQDYLKWIKRGMSRMTHLASIDIRNGRMTREEGLAMIEKYEGLRPSSLDVFLKEMDMTEEEFNEIALRHVVAPHMPPDLSKVKRGPELPDQKDWTINIDIES